MVRGIFLGILMAGSMQRGICASFEAFEFKADTTIYESAGRMEYSSFYYIYTGPDEGHSHVIKNNDFRIMYHVSVFHKKNSDQFDLFSVSGKVGSVIIPASFRPTDYEAGFYLTVLLSRTFIDDDNEWEYILNTESSSAANTEFFRVFESDGTLLFSDSGQAAYGYDGSNTYVIRNHFDPKYVLSYKYWKCRSGLNAASPQSLAKSQVSGPLPMMTFGPTGDYRISLEPAGGGKTTVQLFDMLGKLVFKKTIDQINRPHYFTIPESRVPNSPFISRVSNGNGTVVRKEIPLN